MTELAINVLDCRKPIVSFADFFNEPLSDVVEMDRDFAYFAAASDSPSVASNHALKISFMNFPFILTPAAKALGLYYDNRIRMFSERRQSIMNSVLNGQPSSPYLKVNILTQQYFIIKSDFYSFFIVKNQKRSCHRRRSNWVRNGRHGEPI